MAVRNSIKVKVTVLFVPNVQFKCQIIWPLQGYSLSQTNPASLSSYVSYQECLDLLLIKQRHFHPPTIFAKEEAYYCCQVFRVTVFFLLGLKIYSSSL